MNPVTAVWRVRLNHRKKIKILYLVDGFNIGGAEYNLLQMLEAMDREAYDITLCSFVDRGDLKPAYEALGFPLHIIARRWRFDLSIFKRLYRLIQKGRFDIIQTLLFYPDIIGAVMARLCRVPACIAWETASHYDAFFKPPHRRLFYRLAMRWATCIVTVSEEAKKSVVAVERRPPEQIKVFPNGIDLARFERTAPAALRTEYQADGETMLIGVVARLDAIKGHSHLMEALSEVYKQHSNFQCLLIGDGECRDALTAQVRQLGLQDHVQFLGFRRDIPELLSVLDLFVLPSISEGLPTVVLEAMASTVPVIATRVGGIPEVIQSGENGMLVPSKDSTALAESILQLMNHPQLRSNIAAAGRKRVEEQYSFRRQMEQFETLYHLYAAGQEADR